MSRFLVLALKALCAAGLLLALALPAVAAQKRSVTDAEREACADELIQCVADCTWMDDAGYAACNQDCNEDYGICVRGDDAAMQTSGADAGQSGGFEPPNGRNPHVVAVGLVGAAELERACTSVKGEFSRAADMYGCINRQCDGKGNCVLLCFAGSCTAITPGTLTAPLTLVGILQNGRNVIREGAGGRGTLSGMTGGDEIKEPPSGGSGGVIFY